MTRALVTTWRDGRDGRGRPSGSTRRARGMTLTEIIIVISIIALLAALTMPTLNQLRRISQGDAGVTAVKSAVSVARTLNHRQVHREISDAAGWDAENQSRSGGTGVIFTPSGEMRLVRQDPLAQNAFGEFLIEDSPERAGFRDMRGMDYLTVPRSAGWAGVVRYGPQEDDVLIVPPPFAIRFDSDGRLVTPVEPYTEPDPNDPDEAKKPNTAFIYYSHVATRSDLAQSGGTGGPYAEALSNLDDGVPDWAYSHNPDEWDARIADRPLAPVDWYDPSDRYQLPFYRIPVVSGVLLFNATDFRQEARGGATGWEMDQADIYDYLLYHDPEPDPDNPQVPAEPRARVIHFSPLTGMPLPQRAHAP